HLIEVSLRRHAHAAHLDLVGLVPSDLLWERRDRFVGLYVLVESDPLFSCCLRCCHHRFLVVARELLKVNIKTLPIVERAVRVYNRRVILRLPAIWQSNLENRSVFRNAHFIPGAQRWSDEEAADGKCRSNEKSKWKGLSHGWLLCR